jgi:RNA polymerase sigma-70 factor, ECF subfamily
LALRVALVDALTSLAMAARSGDTSELEAFVRVAYGPVWGLCARLVDEQSADDLAQETFVRAIRSLRQFRGESSARTWLLAIARHTCLDELRSRSRRRRRDHARETEDAQRQVAGADASQEVVIADLIGQLEPARRAAFVLTQTLGLSYDEAAQVCECPPGTIRSRVARARSDLLDMLARVNADGLDFPGTSSSA